jgi:putative ABC transport system substrate-binding protein
MPKYRKSKIQDCEAIATECVGAGGSSHKIARSMEHRAWRKQAGKFIAKLLLGLALGTLLLALSVPVEAQQPGKIPRIGYVTAGGSPKDPGFMAFREGLRKLGYIEGKNVMIEFRSGEAKLDSLPGLVAELVQLKVDALVSSSQPGTRAAKQATKTIPIVMVASFDPVATGIIDSLARPAGNITGVARLQRELGGKRLELLKEANPRITRVGVLWNADSPGPHQAFKEYESAARALKIQLRSLEVRSSNADFESIFRDATKNRANALITARNSILDRYRNQIADLGIKIQTPSMCERTQYVQAGCLISYSTKEEEGYSRAAYYVDRIIKGAKPADLPVEQLTKFEFVINLKTAKQIGLTIPPNVLARADRVIR